jgi:hypothetical protein
MRAQRDSPRFASNTPIFFNTPVAIRPVHPHCNLDLALDVSLTRSVRAKSCASYCCIIARGSPLSYLLGHCNLPNQIAACQAGSLHVGSIFCPPVATVCRRDARHIVGIGRVFSFDLDDSARGREIEMMRCRRLRKSHPKLHHARSVPMLRCASSDKRHGYLECRSFAAVLVRASLATNRLE